MTAGDDTWEYYILKEATAKSIETASEPYVVVVEN